MVFSTNVELEDLWQTRGCERFTRATLEKRVKSCFSDSYIRILALFASCVECSLREVYGHV